MKKGKKIALFICLGLVVSLGLAVAIPFSIYGVRTALISNDYSYLFKEGRIEDKKIEGVPLVKQEISCGYAIIEMLSSYYGNKVTEKELYERNNHGVSTATTGGFVAETNKTIGEGFSSKEYLKNDELLLTINRSLLENRPVPVEWAAKLENEWTIHWSVVTGMDQKTIYINNPYGHFESISYDEFLSRTSFQAYKTLQIPLHFGFAYGLFSKNTIIVRS